MRSRRRSKYRSFPASLVSEDPLANNLAPHEKQLLDAEAARLSSKQGPRDNVVLNRIQSDAEAKQAYRFLTEKARHRYGPAAARILLFHVEMDKQWPDYVMKMCEQAMVELTRGADRLSKLCTRLRDDADRVAAANNDGAWCAVIPQSLGPFRESGAKRKAIDDFESLPRSLRLYADSLEIKLRGARVPTSRPSRRSYQSLTTLVLLRLVRAMAGQCYFERVASILRAVRQSEEREARVSAASLRQLWHRPNAIERVAAPSPKTASWRAKRHLITSCGISVPQPIRNPPEDPTARRRRGPNTRVRLAN